MKSILALFVACATASSASAATILADVSDPVGLPGYKTVTLSVLGEEGVDFRGVFGEFIGPLNQVRPLNKDTPTQNLNDFFHVDASQDSQFLVRTQDLISFGDISEDANSLKGTFFGYHEFIPPLPNPTPFVQLVILDEPNLGSNIQFTIKLADDFAPRIFFGTLDQLIVPELSTLGLMGIMIVSVSATRYSFK